VAQPPSWDPKLNSVTDVVTVDIHEVPQVSLFTKKVMHTARPDKALYDQV